MAQTYSWRLKAKLTDPAEAVAALYQFAKFGARLEARRSANGDRRLSIFVLCGSKAVETLKRLEAAAPGSSWEACTAYEADLTQAPQPESDGSWLQ